MSAVRKPSEPVRFVANVAQRFMDEVLGLPPDLVEIEPETTIYDFGPLSLHESLRSFERRVIRRAVASFGVDITPVLNEPLCEVFYFIRTRMPRPALPLPRDPKDRLPFES